MKYLFVLSILICSACNQEGMSDEHRQKLKQEAADRKIQRVTDADILNAAKIQVEEVYSSNQSKRILQKNAKWISLQDSATSGYEQQIQEAYQYSLNQGLALYDNIEDTKDGKIIFTKPGIVSDSIHGFWLITLDKKEVIKGLQ